MRLLRLHTLAAMALAAAAAVVGPAAQATAATTSPAPQSRSLTPQQAVAQARSTGSAVEVTGSTTATDTLTARPDGSFTMTRSLLPVRRYTKGSWAPLDATLHRLADGSIAPVNTTSELRFSPGGTAPLATMTSAGRSFGLTMPMALPSPTLSGDTATYASVLPGVDLQVRADRQGGFSQVLVVRDAAAARNPALRSLHLAVTADRLTLTAAADGSLTAVDSRGQAVFGAPAPIMWDSATSAIPTVPDQKTGQALDARTGTPADSDARTPGASAHRAAVRTTVSAGRLTLIPDTAMLDGQATYPLYIDPTWTPVNPTRSAWATVSHSYPSTNYWNKTPDPDGRLQVGNSDESLLPNGIWSRSFLNFAIPVTTLAGATINAAELNMLEVHSYSCTKTTLNVFAPTTTLSSANATWNSWSSVNLGTPVASVSAAYGRAGCPAQYVGFSVLGAVQSAVTGNKTTQTFVLAGVNEATDFNSYKEFDLGSVTLRVDYNHRPSTPTGLTTSPATSCTASPPSTVGDADVLLYAPVSDPNGNTLSVTYQVWKTSVPGTIIAPSSPSPITAGSGTTAVFRVTQATLRAAANSQLTQFSWRVQTRDHPTDGLFSLWSATCSFMFDPSRTGAPSVTVPASSTMGQAASFDVVKAPTGIAPTSYLYQLNGGAPKTVAASSGSATIVVAPTRFTNALTVTGLSAAGNVGDSATVIFTAQPAAPAAHDDLTGDGKADLLTVGAVNGLPQGLWQAAGTTTSGSINAIASDIGVSGNGVSGAYSPADFTGAQVITGRFTGSGLQDVLVYYPGGFNAGGGAILAGSGDGSAIQSQQSSNVFNIPSGMLTDNNGLNPLQLANAGDGSNRGLVHPDLIAVGGDANGYYLSYYPNLGWAGGYPMAYQLPDAPPVAGTAWNTWTIASAQTATGPAMFLWHRATGALYLWRGLSFDMGTGLLSHSTTTIRASGWGTGVAQSLQASDVNGDGVPDLRTVGAGGVATTHLVTAGATPTINGQAAQTVITASHAWTLNDATSGQVTTARDVVGTLNLTGNAGTTWATGDLFSPDVAFNGTSGMLATSAKAVDTNADFTVSAWVFPTTMGGVVLSQDGVNTAGFKLWLESSDQAWHFALPETDTAGGMTGALSPAGSAKLGVWTLLTATYRQSTGVFNLSVNGAIVGSAFRTATWNATGPLRVGAAKVGAGTYGGYLAGRIANVQVWNKNLDPAAATTPVTYAGEKLVGNLRDITKDGRPDLVTQQSDGDVVMRPGTGLVGPGQFGPAHTLCYQCGIYTSPAVADIDNNGTIDLFVKEASNGNMYAFPNNAASGTPVYGNRVLVCGGCTDFAWPDVDDANNDGKTDLIVKRTSTGDFLVYPGVGAPGTVAWGSPSVVCSGCGAFDMIGLEDLTGDAKTDLILRDTANYNLYAYPGTAPTGFISYGTRILLCGGCNYGFDTFGYGDANYDGRADLIARRSDDRLAVYLNAAPVGGATWGSVYFG